MPARSRPVTRVLIALAFGALVTAAWPVARVSAEDAPPPPPLPPLEALFLPAKEALHGSNLPAFFRDADLKVHFRTYYFNRTKPDDSVNEALAFGGWLSLRSGWLLDTFAVGATLYGSAPLYAPDDRDGTLLLKPGQEGYYVPGEAWAAFRYKEYALLTGYRQRVDLGYVNSADNRMTPNTFEGVTFRGKAGWVEYTAGYLWEIKPRNFDEFISMSAQAGVKREHDGVAIAGVRLTPIKDLRIDLNDAWGENMFNTLYLEGEYLHAIDQDWKIKIGAQFTDQRAVNDARVQSGDERYWATQVGGVRVQAIFRDLTIVSAFSVTGAGSNIQTPWGSYPGYLSMIDQDFNRANEKAMLFGLAYDFSKLVQGLSAYTNATWGWDAKNPKTGKHVADQSEYDLTVDYRPPFKRPAFLQGLWFRARAAVLDQEDAKRTGYQFRLILNWERDLL